MVEQTDYRSKGLHLKKTDTVMEDTKSIHFIGAYCSLVWNDSKVDHLLNSFLTPFSGTPNNFDKVANVENTITTVSSFYLLRTERDGLTNVFLTMLKSNIDLLSDIFEFLTDIKQIHDFILAHASLQASEIMVDPCENVTDNGIQWALCRRRPLKTVHWSFALILLNDIMIVPNFKATWRTHLRSWSNRCPES